MILLVTAASRSLNLTAGGFCSLANCSRRLNSFMLSGEPPKAWPRCVPSVLLKALRLAGQAHLFHQGEAGAGNIEQSVLFRRVHGHVVLARHGGVDELDDDVVADAFDVAVAPLLERIGGGFAAAFFHGPLVGAAGGMRFDFVRRPVHDVDAAAVGLPAGDARSVMLVGVRDAPVVLFLELVFFGVGRGIAAQPELLDELLALFVGAQALERCPLLVGDDVGDVFVQPLLIRRFQLFAQLFACFFFCSVRSAAWRRFRARGRSPPSSDRR